MLGPIREMSSESLSEPPGLRKEQASLKNPTWSHVETRIRFLTTAHSSSVFLHAANGSTLSIAGDDTGNSSETKGVPRTCYELGGRTVKDDSRCDLANYVDDFV